MNGFYCEFLFFRCVHDNTSAALWKIGDLYFVMKEVMYGRVAGVEVLAKIQEDSLFSEQTTGAETRAKIETISR